MHSLATHSHSCPGPYFGYKKLSISDVSTLFCDISFFFFGSSADFNAWVIALVIDIPFMRCAPYEELICEHGTAHTFCV